MAAPIGSKLFVARSICNHIHTEYVNEKARKAQLFEWFGLRGCTGCDARAAAGHPPRSGKAHPAFGPQSIEGHENTVRSKGLIEMVRTGPLVRRSGKRLPGAVGLGPNPQADAGAYSFRKKAKR
jgi:hypothetical protein